MAESAGRRAPIALWTIGRLERVAESGRIATAGLDWVTGPALPTTRGRWMITAHQINVQDELAHRSPL